MSDSQHFADELRFTRSFLEACTDLKLVELQDSFLREGPEDRRDDLHAVSEELEKRQKKAQEGLMSGVYAVTTHLELPLARPDRTVRPTEAVRGRRVRQTRGDVGDFPLELL